MSAAVPKGYVAITDLRPPVGVTVPNRAEPGVQAALDYVALHRRPPQPLRVEPVEGGLALVDAESYLWWWALRQTGNGISTLPTDFVETVAGGQVSSAPTSPSPDVGSNHVAADPVEDLPLAEVVIDEAYQSRVEMDLAVVEHYAELLREGVQLPPITVCRIEGALVVVDGFHRVAAARAAGRTFVPAVVTPTDRPTALRMAAGANATHGLQRSNADKHRAVLMLLGDETWRERSPNWIAKVCGVSQPFVAKIVKAHSNGLNADTVTTSHGQVRRRGRSGAEPPDAASPQPAPRPDSDGPAGPPRRDAGAAVGLHSPAAGPAADGAGATGHPPAIQLPLPGHGAGSGDGVAAAVAQIPRERDVATHLRKLDRLGSRVRRLVAALAEIGPLTCARWVVEHVDALQRLATRGPEGDSK
ncbi:ParB/RepB/Spo0J family partition protein [Myxococcota bacterium]|nr:ParB/RepB/Spo0J family partition protein [Myxococcota bacterium]